MANLEEAVSEAVSMNTSDRVLKLRFFVVSPVTKLLPSRKGFAPMAFPKVLPLTVSV
jgi:hypothetical protein